jgi:CheY-like chemotaxis protein
MRQIKSVLLVDDDPASNFISQLLLQKSGAVDQITIAGNGQEALDYILQQDNNYPDLILLDINMPQMDGFEFMEQFQQLPHASCSRVVVLSSSVSSKDLQTAASYKIKDFINKPLTKEKLANIMHGIC